jgi:hypothetical protein
VHICRPFCIEWIPFTYQSMRLHGDKLIHRSLEPAERRYAVRTKGTHLAVEISRLHLQRLKRLALTPSRAGGWLDFLGNDRSVPTPHTVRAVAARAARSMASDPQMQMERYASASTRAGFQSYERWSTGVAQ